MELGQFCSGPATGSAARRFRSRPRVTPRPPPLWYLQEARDVAIKQRGSHDGPTAAGARAGTDKADEKELQGEYSNLVMIHHNLEEFTLNFIYIFPNGAQGKLLKSMIVSPGHAKRIFRALGENIARYEAQFGTIKEMPEGGPTPNVGFVQ